MAGFNKLNNGMKKVSYGISYVSMVVIFIIMVLTFVAVMLRYFVPGAGISGMVELTELAMVLIVFLGFSFTQYAGGHVHVDIFTNMIKNLRARFIFNGCIRIVTAFFSFWVTYAAFLRAVSEKVVTGVLKIPVAPFVYVMAIGMAWFSIVLLMDGLDHFLQGVSKEGPTPEKTEADIIVEEALAAAGQETAE